MIALLRFGAANPDEKKLIIDRYLDDCKRPDGGPHVWNPNVEIVEALSVFPHRWASPAEERISHEIESLAEEMLKDIPKVADQSAFSSPTGLRLQAKCVELIFMQEPTEEATVTFFDLMCHTCD